MPNIDFSDPVQVESAVTALTEKVEESTKKADEEKEKYDAILKAMKSNDEVMKKMGKAMEDDPDFKKAMEEDEEMTSSIKKAMEEEDDIKGKKGKKATETEEKEAEEEKEDVKASIKIAKQKYVDDLTASYKLMTKDENAIKAYSSKLEKMPLTALQKEFDNPYRKTLEASIKAQQPEIQAADLPQNIPFNAIPMKGSISNGMILEDELGGMYQ